MSVYRTPPSWTYDFTLEPHGRQRKGGFKTRAEANAAEKLKREELHKGHRKHAFADAYAMYMAGTNMRATTRDNCARFWKEINPVLGALYVEHVRTAEIDRFKAALPAHLSPASVNNRLKIIRATLRFAWKRGFLESVPFVPMESESRPVHDWYTVEERDQLLAGMRDRFPKWYAFFYITCRLGLRAGEVYAISFDRIRDLPPHLIVDREVQRGHKDRPAQLAPRKTDEAYTVPLTPDLLEVIRWHVDRGYAGSEFLFSKRGSFPNKVQSHARPLRIVQRELGLRELSHHKIGRHSVASQAVTAGHSIKTVQGQLGHRSASSTHRYAHLGQDAQRALLEQLTPETKPDEKPRASLAPGNSRRKKVTP